MQGRNHFRRMDSKVLKTIEWISLLWAFAAFESVARADDLTETVESLKAQIQVLTDRVKALEKQQSTAGAIETNAVAADQSQMKKLAVSPTVSLGANGLMIQSLDSNFVAYIHGYIQVNGRFYPGDVNAANDTFLLRRVRPIWEGTVYRNFDYRLMLDFGSGNTVPGSSAGNNALVDDAYLNVHLWHPFQIQVGKFKSPVGLERLESTADLTFIETGFATQLTPNYDLGVQFHNSLFNAPVSYAIGVFNGAADAASDDQDVNDGGKDVAGRIFAQPFLKSDTAALKKLGFGVGGSAGNHRGPVPGYKTPGQQTFFNFASTASADGLQYRIDPQFFYYWGPFGILGEYALSSQKIASTAAGVPKVRLDNTAWQVQVSYFLTGEENTFKPTSLIRVTPLRPFSLTEDTWGAVEIVGRVQQLSLDKQAFPKYAAAGSAREATAWGAGANWYLNRNVKLSLNYEWTFFEQGRPAAGSVTAEDEHFVVVQVQCAF